MAVRKKLAVLEKWQVTKFQFPVENGEGRQVFANEDPAVTKIFLQDMSNAHYHFRCIETPILARKCCKVDWLYFSRNTKSAFQEGM